MTPPEGAGALKQIDGQRIAMACEETIPTPGYTRY